jgi:hypothetical protein
LINYTKSVFFFVLLVIENEDDDYQESEAKKKWDILCVASTKITVLGWDSTLSVFVAKKLLKKILFNT